MTSLTGLSQSADERNRIYKKESPPKSRRSRAKVPPAPWKARVRDANEATSNTFDLRAGDYIPARDNPPPIMRPGAMDYDKYKSLGF